MAVIRLNADLEEYGGANWLQKLRKKRDMTKSCGDGKWTSAGGVVVNDKDEIALVKPSGGYGGYSWTFPKGRVDDGETHDQTALREIGEEAGITGDIIGDLGTHEGTSSHTHYFLVRYTRDVAGARDEETEEVRFVPFAEARRLLHSQRDLTVLRSAEAQWSRIRKKPYGHSAYTRRTKSGKVAFVPQKGVKPVKKALPKSDKEDKVKKTPNKKASSKKAGKTGKTRYNYPQDKKPSLDGAAQQKKQQPSAKPDPVGVPDDPQPKTANPQELANQLQMPVHTLQHIAKRFQDNKKLNGRSGFVSFMQTRLKKFTEKHRLDGDYWGLIFDALVGNPPVAVKPQS